MPEPTDLYRYFDSKGDLLYVGISTDWGRRAREHSRSASWWGNVCSATIERYPSRSEALAAEADAIRSEKPAHNIAHNNDVVREYRRRSHAQRDVGPFQEDYVAYFLRAEPAVEFMRSVWWGDFTAKTYEAFGHAFVEFVYPTLQLQRDMEQLDPEWLEHALRSSRQRLQLAKASGHIGHA